MRVGWLSAAFFPNRIQETAGSPAIPPFCSILIPDLIPPHSHSLYLQPYTPGGYGHVLEQLLEAKGVSVQHAGGDFGGGQCGDTRLGLVCTNTSGPGYLNTPGTFDLIHFNYGLHDLANYSAALPRLPLPQYEANLQAIYARLQSRSKLVMWTSTTPAPNVTQPFGRSFQIVKTYNEHALSALTSVATGGKLLINDLWTAMVDHCGYEYTKCDLQLPENVHLTPAGIDFTAASAAKDILAALGM